MKKFELVIAIVNQGYSEELMYACRSVGAKGGTIINARGTAREEAEKKFNITIHPEKEIVLILVNETIKDEILHTIYKTVGLQTEGQGIAFTVPVDEVIGIDGKQKKPIPEIGLSDNNNYKEKVDKILAETKLENKEDNEKSDVNENKE